MSARHQNRKCHGNPFDEIWKGWSPEYIQEQIQGHRKRRKIYLDLILKWLPRKDNNHHRLLEVGCGTSIDVHIIAQTIKADAYGIDISKESIEKSKMISQHFDTHVNLDIQDALQMNFENDFFDLVFSQGVLEHFTDPQAAIIEQLRVLKPDGVLIISVPQTFCVYTLYKHILMAQNKWPWGHETEFSYYRLKKIARENHLKILDSAGYDYWKHPCEPFWLFRSLNLKRQKLFPLGHGRWLDKIFKTYDTFWDSMEKKWGCFFMKNIVFVYKKEKTIK
jgi:ubiquinone/menaquinone biosynthesis C-methylase UbiE